MNCLSSRLCLSSLLDSSFRYFSCLSFIDTSDLFYKIFLIFQQIVKKVPKRKNKVDTSELMTKFLEMEEKAERQFWEFEEKRMKLEQEQEERRKRKH
jgi:hypothetical protein